MYVSKEGHDNNSCLTESAEHNCKTLKFAIENIGTASGMIKVMTSEKETEKTRNIDIHKDVRRIVVNGENVNEENLQSSIICNYVFKIQRESINHEHSLNFQGIRFLEVKILVSNAKVHFQNCILLSVSIKTFEKEKHDTLIVYFEACIFGTRNFSYGNELNGKYNEISIGKAKACHLLVKNCSIAETIFVISSEYFSVKFLSVTFNLKSNSYSAITIHKMYTWFVARNLVKLDNITVLGMI